MKRKGKNTRGKRSTTRVLMTRLGLAALSRIRLPLWAKIAIGVAAIGTVGVTAGLSSTKGLDSILGRRHEL